MARPSSPRDHPSSTTIGLKVKPMAKRAPPLTKRTRKRTARVRLGREDIEGCRVRPAGLVGHLARDLTQTGPQTRVRCGHCLGRSFAAEHDSCAPRCCAIVAPG